MAEVLDIILFGATGFTGKHAIPVIHKLSKARNRSLTWGVAGRSEEKLKDALKFAEKEVGTSLEKIPIVIADIKDEKSLLAMAEKARIIINCCGPYRFYGEPVVKACVEKGTHHVDVSGEPQYMEGMQLKYHKQAQEKGAYIVSACGLDSIPTDLGVIFLEQKFGGTLNSVVTYLETWTEGDPLPGPAVNFGTWESAVYGLAHADELRGLRRQLYPQRLPSFEPKLLVKTAPHKVDVVDGWAIPFPGSDRSVVRRSQRYFYDNESKRPIQVETYFVLKSVVQIVMLGIMAFIFAILARFEFGRSLLLKHPKFFSAGFFSHENPSEEKCKQAWFQITFYGKGWKEPLANPDDKYTSPVDKAMTTRVKGQDPGYGATNICLVLAAIVILTEKEKLPSVGGVYPPGAAFAKTSIIEQLNENGVTFEVISEKNLVPAKH